MIVTLKPSLAVTDAQAQAIVDRVAPGRRLAHMDEMLAGEIGAVFELELADGPPAFVLKVHPETLHWKMRKEMRIAGLLDGRLSVPTPRILLAARCLHDTEPLPLRFPYRQRARGAAQRSAAAHRQRRSRERHRRRPADGSRQDARLLGTRRRTKRAGLLEGYGPIDRPNWQATLRLYQFYGAIELWTWWTRIGDAARAEHIVADLERYA